MEVETNNILPVLEVLLERTLTSFLTSVYMKHNVTELYLSWDSFSATSRKINLIKTPTDQVLIKCSKLKPDAKLMKITIFFDRGHPKSVIQTNIRLIISKFNEIKTLGSTKCHVYVRLP